MGSAFRNGCKIDRRKTQRFPTDIAAKVMFERKETDARIKDISTLGCCLSIGRHIAKGEEIVLHVGDLCVVATVAWATGTLVGANFHREINPLQVVRDTSAHPMFYRRRLANSMIALATPATA